MDINKDGACPERCAGRWEMHRNRWRDKEGAFAALKLEHCTAAGETLGLLSIGIHQ